MSDESMPKCRFFANAVRQRRKRGQTFCNRSLETDVVESEAADAEFWAELKLKLRKVMSSLVPVLFDLFRRHVLQGVDIAKPITVRLPSGKVVVFEHISYPGHEADSVARSQRLHGRIEPVAYDATITVTTQDEVPYPYRLDELLLLIDYRYLPDRNEYVASQESQQQFTTGLLRITLSLQQVQ